MLLKASKTTVALCSVCLLLSLSQCAQITGPGPSPSSPQKPALEPDGDLGKERAPEEPTSRQPSPRALASLQLTEQGRLLLMRNQPDAAIRTLERAINLSPHHGPNYYYLAEAWLFKGNFNQSLEFNRLAAIYLREDPAWMSRVNQQRTRIDTIRTSENGVPKN